MPARSSSVHSIELDLFIEALARRHGYDFRNYARASLKRRVAALATRLGCGSIAELLPR
ncbi:MAG: protein-glutamate O-methyltransferase CheR, partial [Magnetospirillum sp.]